MHFSHINSLRGIAILMVVLVHTSQLFTFNTRVEEVIFDYGKMGVQLFFIASAYTLCLSEDSRKKEGQHLIKFYIRRFFRIFPIYYLGIILYFILNYYSGTYGAYTFKNVLSNLFFIHGLIPSANNSIVPGGWSIGTEMLFYLIFPFLFRFLKSGNSFIKGAIIIFVAELVIFYFQRKPSFNYEFFYFNILNQISVFVIGIFFFLHKKYLTNERNAIIIFVIFTAIALFVSGNQDLFKIKGYRYAFRILPIISAISFCSLFVIAESFNIVNNIVFQKIGINSYSIYIIHFVLPFFILPKMEGYVNFIMAYVIIVTSSYVISKLLNTYVEKPFISLGNRIIKSIKD
ncbi:acyltransferase family protein [Chryseobacterium herbae]|uniref:Acyltransferase n=1 Tax=Chryseobacterium herbae TaxID=2976476 RepID=A0ABT2IZ27_9FLAO|nr:acyltransferase [Chryseobacterium sp. pc1-10]MCT2563937.1 acyltransferase [Chryseobacterium sp. pc1-10]